MSVLPSDIVAYGSANMPEADSVTIGGAVDTTKRVAFYDITPSGNVDVISTASADTATICRVYGRDGTGAIQNASMTLNGQTWVAGSQSFERLLYAALSGASANGPVANPGGTAATGDIVLAAHAAVLPAGSNANDATIHTAQVGSANASGATPALFKTALGDVAGGPILAGQIIWIRSGTGANQARQVIATTGYGTDIVAVSRNWTTVPAADSTYKVLQGMLFEISPNPVTAIIRMFATSAADVPGGSQRIYYEKVFVVNNNTVTALTGAQIEVASETPTLPSGALLDIALCTALQDTNTVANRQTTPVTGVGTFTTQPAFVNVPGAGNLPPGAAPNAAGAQGVWMRLTLPAGTSAYKGSADLRTQGTTT
jgi:hypothetical protein